MKPKTMKKSGTDLSTQVELPVRPAAGFAASRVPRPHDFRSEACLNGVEMGSLGGVTPRGRGVVHLSRPNLTRD